MEEIKFNVVVKEANGDISIKVITIDSDNKVTAADPKTETE
jgi:hypothetical protein